MATKASDKQRGVPAPSQILLSLQLSLEPEKTMVEPTILLDIFATSRHTKKRGKFERDSYGQRKTSSMLAYASISPHGGSCLSRDLFDEMITRWDVHTFDTSIRSQCGLVYSHIFVVKHLGNRPACKSGSTVLNRACLTRTPRQTNALKGTCWCLNPKRRKHLCRHLIVISV